MKSRLVNLRHLLELKEWRFSHYFIKGPYNISYINYLCLL